MDEFIKNFGIYWKAAPFDTFLFWMIPAGTIFAIWLLTTVGMKIFGKRKILKTAFLVNKAWVIGSLTVAMMLIAIIGYYWSQNIFAKEPYQMALFISLALSFAVPLIAFVNLRKYYSSENMNEIIDQPKTMHEFETRIPLIKKAFDRIKLYYFLPVLGFLFLLFSLSKGTNLISIVFDNSGNMETSNAMNALSETFETLEDNNEIILTTLEGLSSADDAALKQSIAELMLVSQSQRLKAGLVHLFNTPVEAQSSLHTIFNSGQTVYGSPISESIWKTWLTVKESKANQEYRNRLLIIITDGLDNIDASLTSGNFFFDNNDFSAYFAPENTFVIDYSGGKTNNFLQRCMNAGCDIYPAGNSKEVYLDALDNVLQSFKNNSFLIYWLVLIVCAFTVTGILIPSKKIV
ncbi:MAG: hypothetical protein LBC19_04885 [Tannerella sp.]|jgi:hypothetical protein|nr:hypothetical protein [Tannerella sp.]